METNPDIESVLAKSNENPPAHPHLVEHLREKFTLYLPADPNFSAEASHAFVHTRQGEQNVIDYIESLVHAHQQEGTPAHEPKSPEGQGTDSRRPGTRSRS